MFWYVGNVAIWSLGIWVLRRQLTSGSRRRSCRTSGSRRRDKQSHLLGRRHVIRKRIKTNNNHLLSRGKSIIFLVQVSATVLSFFLFALPRRFWSCTKAMPSAWTLSVRSTVGRREPSKRWRMRGGEKLVRWGMVFCDFSIGFPWSVCFFFSKFFILKFFMVQLRSKGLPRSKETFVWCVCFFFFKCLLVYPVYPLSLWGFTKNHYFVSFRFRIVQGWWFRC